ncbi:unnamed protein product, partial [Ectocarpus sp. 12 AP-2014]
TAPPPRSTTRHACVELVLPTSTRAGGEQHLGCGTDFSRVLLRPFACYLAASRRNGTLNNPGDMYSVCWWKHDRTPSRRSSAGSMNSNAAAAAVYWSTIRRTPCAHTHRPTCNQLNMRQSHREQME